METDGNTSKAERTRRFIIERTAPIFNTKGFAGTSLTDITGATGLTKGSIYGNFANKDEVALAVFDYNLNKVATLLKAELSTKTTYKEKLLVYASTYGKFLSPAFPVGGCPILNTAIEADDTHPRLRKKAAEAMLSLKGYITRLIEKGVEAGEFRHDVKPEQTALAIIALFEGAIMISKLLGKPNYLKEIQEVTSNLIEGLG